MYADGNKAKKGRQCHAMIFDHFASRRSYRISSHRQFAKVHDTWHG